jgi:predicted lipid-binding transport protein (Tim44 family)
VSYYRHPYVGEGADGARRSAQIDREEADGLDADDQRRATLLESAARWEEQAEAIERQRAWTPPPPRPQPSGGRITAFMLGGALLGVLVGWLLPGFLVAVVSGGHVGAATALMLAGWLVCVPLGGILGSLWGLHQARRRPRPPVDLQQRPNQVIRRRRPGE